MKAACSGKITDRIMNAREYDYRRKLRIQQIGDIEYVVKKIDLDNTIKKYGVYNQYMCPKICHMSALFDALFEAHTSTGHAASARTYRNASDKFSNIPESLCAMFCSLCPICVRGKMVISRKPTLTPIISKAFNDRGQIDLIDMQSAPDGPYNWIMHYQDHLTKFTYLRALRTKSK